MKKSESNAKQRKQALLRAILLVLSVMIFTGFGVALFPLANWGVGEITGRDCKLKGDSLALLKTQEAKLVQYLSRLEVQYDSIKKLDKDWEKVQEQPSAATDFKDGINKLEKDISSIVTTIQQAKLGTVANKSASAYDYLANARALIWKLREDNSKINPPPPPPPPGLSTSDLLKMEARGIANDLEDEIKLLESKKFRGILGNKKEVQAAVEKVVSNLKGLVNRLRSL